MLGARQLRNCWLVLTILVFAASEAKAQTTIETGKVMRRRYYPKTATDTFAYIDVYWRNAESVKGEATYISKDSLVALNMLSRSGTLVQISGEEKVETEDSRANTFFINLGGNTAKNFNAAAYKSDRPCEIVVEQTKLQITRPIVNRGTMKVEYTEVTQLTSSEKPSIVAKYVRGATLVSYKGKKFETRDSHEFFELNPTFTDIKTIELIRRNELEANALHYEDMEAAVGDVVNISSKRSDFPSFSAMGILSYYTFREEQMGGAHGNTDKTARVTIPKNSELLYFQRQWYPPRLPAIKKLAHEAMLQNLRLREIDPESYPAVMDYANFDLNGSWYIDEKGVGMIYGPEEDELKDVPPGQLEWHLPWSEMLQHLDKKSPLQKLKTAAAGIYTPPTETNPVKELPTLKPQKKKRKRKR